jgi:hypothetical protein
MKKSDWQYLVDSLLFICMGGIVFIGIMLGLFLPQGPSAPESSKYFLNLHRHQWGNIHFYLSIVFVVLVTFHLILSWKWIKARASHIFKKKWKAALLFTVFLSVLVLFLFWAFYPKDPSAYEDYGIRAGKRGGDLPDERSSSAQNQDIIITGKLTLGELEKTTGLPSHQITEALGLPPKISKKETLGRLSKKYGFTLVEMRDKLTQILEGQDPLLVPKSKGPEIRQEELEERQPQKPASDERIQIVITGQMSLNDIQRETGVSASEIIAHLGLPPDAPPNENLGRLSRAYSITLLDIRDALSKILDPEKFIVEEHTEEQTVTRGRMAEDQSGIVITGQMSLYEVEKLTGIPSQKIIEKLGLPQNVPRSENLGRLRRRYGFTIQEARDVVASLTKNK